MTSKAIAGRMHKIHGEDLLVTLEHVTGAGIIYGVAYQEIQLEPDTPSSSSMLAKSTLEYEAPRGLLPVPLKTLMKKPPALLKRIVLL